MRFPFVNQTALKNLVVLIIIISPLRSINGQTKNVEAFPLSQVRLLDSPFKTAMLTDMKYILALDADRLLSPYLREAGLPPKAQSYGNWENTGLDGHIGGHYLSAVSMMYAATGDQRMKERMEYMLSELRRAQIANGDGYLGGIPGGKAMWQEISEGHIDAGSFSLNKKWVPLYNIHKIFAGLRDAWLYGNSALAKQMLIELSDWTIHLVENLSDAQIQKMLISEHGGLNEVFADVAAITGDEKYLHLAIQFSHRAILEPLINGEDKLTGLHANTQIPKVIGYKRISEINGDSAWAYAARFFWNDVIDKRSVSIGGNSVREHFHPVDDYSEMISSEQGPETCNTYNMLKLTKHLFLSDPQVKYTDYYERALYNHILSTEEPEHGGFVYFTPMRPGHYRVYSQPQTSFWCCVGSGLENHTKYGEMIYAHSDDDIYVNLFIPSVLNWNEKKLQLTQETNFPDAEKTTLTVNPNKKSSFALLIRYPKWMKPGTLKIKVNGKMQTINASPGQYVSLRRTWKKGDKVELQLPMQTTVEQLPDGENYFSFQHGPIVLAAKTDTLHMDGLYADDSRGGHIAAGPKYPLNKMPVIVTSGEQLPALVKPIPDHALTFRLDSIYPEKYAGLELMPFFRIHESRYIIYFQVIKPEELKMKEAEIALGEAQKQALEQSTIDLVFPGEQQPESDHFIESDQSNSGVHLGKHWRDASGWFSYLLTDKNKEATKLRVMYYGADNNREFTISINENKIAAVKLDGSKGDNFFTVDYTISQDIINQSEGKLKVKFEAHPGSIAGGIFEVRLMK